MGRRWPRSERWCARQDWTATRCPEGTFWRSPEVARCGLTCRLAAPILAGRGLVSISIGDRWLPTIRLMTIRVCQSASPYRGDSASPGSSSGTWARKHMTTRDLGPQRSAGTGLPGALRPHVRRRRTPSQCDRGPRGELATLTARHDEMTAGAGPLRAIPVRPQVALPALRALLAPRPLTKTHQHTVTIHRAGFTMPRSLSAPIGL